MIKRHTPPVFSLKYIRTVIGKRISQVCYNMKEQNLGEQSTVVNSLEDYSVWEQ